MEIIDVVFSTVVGQIQVIGAGRILCGESVDLLHDGGYAKRLAQLAHFQYRVLRIGHAVLEHAACYLEVGEALLLGLAQELFGKILKGIAQTQFVGSIYNIRQPVEEPAVDLGQFMYAL